MRRSRDAYDRSVVSIVVFSGILNIFCGFRSFCGIRQRIHVDCRGIAIAATMFAALQWQAVEHHFIRRVFTVAFPRNRQSPRFPNDAPDHARASHTGIRHQPTRDANATCRRHRSAAAVPPPCGMGRADDRRRDQAGTARRPAERQNALLAVASPAVGGRSRICEVICALLCVVIMRYSRVIRHRTTPHCNPTQYCIRTPQERESASVFFGMSSISTGSSTCTSMPGRRPHE